MKNTTLVRPFLIQLYRIKILLFPTSLQPNHAYKFNFVITNVRLSFMVWITVIRLIKDVPLFIQYPLSGGVRRFLIEIKFRHCPVTHGTDFFESFVIPRQLHSFRMSCFCVQHRRSRCTISFNIYSQRGHRRSDPTSLGLRCIVYVIAFDNNTFYLECTDSHDSMNCASVVIFKGNNVQYTTCFNGTPFANGAYFMLLARCDAI